MKTVPENVPRYRFSFEHETDVNSVSGLSIVLTNCPFEFKIKTLPFLPRTIKKPMMSDETASKIFCFTFNFFTVLKNPASHSQILMHYSSTVESQRYEPWYAVLKNLESDFGTS